MQNGIFKAIGNTPMVNINIGAHPIMLKLECMNPFGSMKDRTASFVVNALLQKEEIYADTTIIESSSGNFAIALSGVCAALGMKCICVVDNNLTDVNRQIIEQYGGQVHRVDTPQKKQSYQEKRIEVVKQLLCLDSNTYWTNQYDNQLIQQGYFPLAEEILTQYPQLERIYIPVGTCGTIAGISVWIKKHKPNVKIVAVDSYGSQIFEDRLGRNRFTGMGSRICPGNLKSAIIDEVVRVSDYECVIGCRSLLKLGIFAGASSGAVIAAIKKSNGFDFKTVALIPDRGDRYLDNLYNQKWINDNLPILWEEKKAIATKEVELHNL